MSTRDSRLEGQVEAEDKAKVPFVMGMNPNNPCQRWVQLGAGNHAVWHWFDRGPVTPELLADYLNCAFELGRRANERSKRRRP